MAKGRIIVLNGVSSSGKTTLGRELVKWLPDFFTQSWMNLIGGLKKWKTGRATG